MAFFHSSSWMSLSRTALPLRRYSPSPVRNTRWLICISSSVFCSTRVTSAMPTAARLSVPLKMASSAFSPRTVRTRWPPRTHWMASTILLLPVPLGPMMMVIPGLKRIFVRSGNVLKPWSSSRLMYMMFDREVLYSKRPVMRSRNPVRPSLTENPSSGTPSRQRAGRTNRAAEFACQTPRFVTIF